MVELYIKNMFNLKNQMEPQVDSSSAVLISLGGLFSGAAGGFMQTNFWWAVVCAVVAVGCFVVREFIKQ